ncbi:MAG: septum formation protein Maf [Calditrichaeota bacterium]|nr:septum formation protein Maf [Calditrichota bacterium]
MSDKLIIPSIILASASPRRQILLQQVGIPFEVIIPHTEELAPQGGDFPLVAMTNADAKARSVGSRVAGRPILAADTLVELDGEPLGKPRDADAARSMLTALSGRMHTVYTGYTLVDEESGKRYPDYAVTDVWFRQLGWREIESYIASGEPFDKAGAYGIQARGALLIERINGCFFNVMGLPIVKVWETMKRWMTDRGVEMEGW